MSEHVSLSEILPNEAHDFTPWLAKQKLLLHDICNDTVEVFRREMPIKKYFMDLTLKSSTNTFFIIENQYGEANHDHLGKCILYAILTHAEKVFWIAEEFLPEHEQIIRELPIQLVLVQLTVQKKNTEEYILNIDIEEKEKSRHHRYTLNKEKQCSKIF